MRSLHRTFTLAAALAALSCGGTADEAPSPDTTSDAATAIGKHEPPMLGIHWARGQAGNPHGASPLMTWHSGAIMTSATVQAIFWGTSWSSASFTGDKRSGLDGFYAGVGSTRYASTNTEYSGTNGQVGTSVAYLGSQVDPTAAPSNAPKTSAILAEVCARIPNPVSNGYYPVYVDTRRGQTRYCAWHSYGTCGTVPVQFAFFFSLDGDAGCDPNDSSGLHSQGLAALANVSGHEYSEAITDPRNGGWYDSSGAENSDKCAWTFGAPLLTFTNGTQWKIQGNWSNAAFQAGTGYPNSSGQNGCLSGL